jgi:acyl-coenzyme A thioesterase PaaI-like protein
MDEFLGTDAAGGGVTRFTLGPDVHGAFGGVFGGAVAAACVRAARSCAPGRRPFSAHVTFVRGLATPTCTATATAVAAGRTVTTVGVDLHDDGGRLAARATVSFAAPEALDPMDVAGALAPPDVAAYEDGRDLAASPAFEAPILRVLAPRLVGTPEGGYAQAVQLPWRPLTDTAAEAACMAADLCVGVPVGAALDGRPVAIPNPDLSLRFLGEEAAAVLVGVGRLARVDAGMAATAVEVWAGTVPVAIGLSSAVLLGARPR